FPREAGCIPLQVVLGSQMLHAVGIAQAIKYDQAANVVVAACGDGATSEGDFSEALNFAGVFKAPVIFVVINNGWAISTPRAQQTAANYIADRGPGFGIPSYVVDGNDILALYQLMLDSIARARAGEGPTLVEAITYRLGAHTTADDPAKYRSETELAEWRLRDPLIRFRKFLVDRQMLTEAEDRRFYAEAETEITTSIEAFEALPPPKVQQLFDLVYADPTPQIQCQRERLLRELSSRQE
ncbi:MAG: thiamine pyrophosphate-dependent enzyme, partial [Anaerolineae bacterium]|nr:thiamine pyrophosphate-dependent enzyme [Anaerolineae bacterium]